MKVLGFAASNSKNSINAKIIEYVLSKIDCKTEIINIIDYETSIYSIDSEAENGIPQKIHEFLAKISDSDLIVISHAEHNGNYNVFYKNLIDWCSRARRDIFQNKKLILLSTSPGKLGGQNVLDIAKNSAKSFAGDICEAIPIPNFYDVFVDEKIIDKSMNDNIFNAFKKLDIPILNN
ncbi:NAD(P)H-dependent oxidoreductase [Francisellaceae bacterium CB299]|jgi:chromate reductase, NAD(P)H dehydrogenase (quinone)